MSYTTRRNSIDLYVMICNGLRTPLGIVTLWMSCARDQYLMRIRCPAILGCLALVNRPFMQAPGRLYSAIIKHLIECYPMKSDQIQSYNYEETGNHEHWNRQPFGIYCMVKKKWLVILTYIKLSLVV